MRVVPLRLTPGAELRLALDAWMRQQSEQAGGMNSGIGSLSPDGACLLSPATHPACAGSLISLLQPEG